MPKQLIKNLRLPHKRHLHFSAKVVGALVAIPLFLLGIFLIRLQAGPLLVPFVGTAIENAVNRALGDKYFISVQGAVLEPGDANLVALRLQNMALFNQDGKMVGAAPFATADLDFASLLQLKPQASSVTLLGPVMVLKWNRAGEIELVPGLVPTEQQAEIARKFVENASPVEDVRPEKEDFLGQDGGIVQSGSDFLTTGLSTALRQAFEASPVRPDGLTQLEVRNAILRVEHEETGAIWRVAPINFTSLATVEERIFEVRASVLEGARPWRVSARLTGKDALSDKTMMVGFEDLLLATATGPLARFAGIPLNAPLSSQFSGTLTPTGEWEDVSFQGQLGTGQLNMGKGKPPLSFGGAELVLDYLQGSWAIRQFDLLIEDTKLALGGLIEPQGDDSYGVDLNATYRATSGELANILPEARAHLDGLIDLAAQRVDINTLKLETDRISLDADLNASWQSGRPEFSLSGGATEISAKDLKAIWPSFAIPGVRQWVYEHLEAGLAKNISYYFSLDTEGELQRRFTAELENGTFSYFKDLPPVQEANAQLLLEGNIFTAQLLSGYVEPVANGRIDLKGSNWTSHLTGPEAPDRADLQIKASGHASPLLYLLDAPSLQLLRKANLRLDNVEGKVAGEARLQFPILPEVPEDQFSIEARAKVSGFSADGIVPQQRLEQGNFDLSLGADGLEIQGSGTVQGAKITLTATRDAEPQSIVRYNGIAVLDEAARTKMNIPINEFVKGPVRAIFAGTSEEPPNRFDVDLSGASVALPQVGYSKPSGDPAQLSFTYVDSEDGYIGLQEIIYSAGPVNVRGDVVLNRKDGLISATLPTFTFQEGDDLSVTLEKKKSGYAIDLRGARFNAAPFLENRSSANGASSSGAEQKNTVPLDVTLSVGALVGANQQLIRNLSASVRLNGTKISNLNVDGVHGEGGALLARQDGDAIYIESQNAGSLLRFADTYTSMRGGLLRLSANTAEGVTAGNANVTNFIIINDRVVQTIATATGNVDLAPLKQASQTGLAFDLFTVDFRLDPNKLLFLNRLRVKGPAAGATGDGVVNLNTKVIDFSGTFVPAFGLNNMFSQVPVFGRILGRNRDEGLFGITFDVRGTTENPKISVKPLSALAPGIFRKIFE